MKDLRTQLINLAAIYNDKLSEDTDICEFLTSLGHAAHDFRVLADRFDSRARELTGAVIKLNRGLDNE
jgi:hypothetical protein